MHMHLSTVHSALLLCRILWCEYATNYLSVELLTYTCFDLFLFQFILNMQVRTFICKLLVNMCKHIYWESISHKIFCFRVCIYLNLIVGTQQSSKVAPNTHISCMTVLMWSQVLGLVRVLNLSHSNECDLVFHYGFKVHFSDD